MWSCGGNFWTNMQTAGSNTNSVSVYYCIPSSKTRSMKQYSAPLTLKESFRETSHGKKSTSELRTSPDSSKCSSILEQPRPGGRLLTGRIVKVSSSSSWRPWLAARRFRAIFCGSTEPSGVDMGWYPKLQLKITNTSVSILWSSLALSSSLLHSQCTLQLESSWHLRLLHDSRGIFPYGTIPEDLFFNMDEAVHVPAGGNTSFET